MNEQQKETLSALLDGEASEFELRRLLAEGDVEIAAQWRRYQLIRDVGGSSHAGSAEGPVTSSSGWSEGDWGDGRRVGWRRRW